MNLRQIQLGHRYVQYTDKSYVNTIFKQLAQFQDKKQVWISLNCSSSAQKGRIRSADLGYQSQTTSKERPKYAKGIVREDFQTMIEMWDLMLSKYRDVTAVIDSHHKPQVEYTYGELFERVQNFAAAIQSLGIQKGDNVCIYGENSARWMIADHGCFMSGAADAVRSHTAEYNELEYIFKKTEAKGLVLENVKTLEKLDPLFQSAQSNGNGSIKRQAMKFVVLLYGDVPEVYKQHEEIKFFSFDEFQQLGIQQVNKGQLNIPNIVPSDTLTLVFTSGTTGKPKAAVLTHSNLVYQTHAIKPRIQLVPGQKILSFLPIWHIYERAVVYLTMSCGLSVICSSKLTLVNDLKKHRPDYATCVPQVLDFMQKKVLNTIKKSSKLKKTMANFFIAVSTFYIKQKRVIKGLSLVMAMHQFSRFQLLIAQFYSFILAPIHFIADKLVYKKIRDQIGVQKAMVSGGGSLSSYLDDFYEVIGLCVINGWGLTETSPVIACRGYYSQFCPRMTTGKPLQDTKVRIVNVDNPFEEVLPGKKGLITVDGPGVLKQYYNEPEETEKAFQYSPPGTRYFNTGDLGFQVPLTTFQEHLRGALVITGRAKDTIVLLNGENVEPAPLEDAIMQSPYLSQVLVIGQDAKFLGALVYPNKDFLKDQGQDSLPDDELTDLLNQEVKRCTENKGFLPHEQISAVQIITKPFSAGDGTMTQTVKPKRPKIYEMYQKEINQLYKRLSNV